MSELFIVMDSVEEDQEEEQHLQELVNCDTDSGLDSSDEDYMNIEIFA